MAQNKSFPIVFVCDDNYAVPSIVAITSIIVNRNKDVNFKFYVISNGLSKHNKEYFYSFEREYDGVKVEIIDLDATKYENIYTHYDGDTGAGSITALCKFDIPLLIKEDKVLYLDCDVIVKKDISEIFSTNLEGKLAAVILDSGRMYITGGWRDKLPQYFNSGVMLLNLDLMRDLNITDKLIEMKRDSKIIELVDQVVFNEVFNGRTVLLPIKYNALMVNLNNSISRFDMRQLNNFYSTNYSCLYDLEDDVSILHFASKEKPWLYDDVRFSELWMKYYKISPCTEKLTRTHYKGTHNRRPQTIPVMMATDANYTPQTCVTIVSILENASANDSYKFYILTPEHFSEDIFEKFDLVAKKYGNATIECVEMKEAFKDAKLNIAHITTPTYYRLNAPSVFPQYDKIIYLDSDVIVEGDLGEYYSIDIEGFYVAGVKAPSYHLAKNGNKAYCLDNGLPAIDQYINAGIIMFNLKALRENNIEEEFMRRAPKGYRSQDQDVINGACYGHIKQLECKYNCMLTAYEPRIPLSDVEKVFSRDEMREAHNRPVIIHFADKNKPWQTLSCGLADRWWKYARLSPFFDSFLLRSCEWAIDDGKKKRFGINTDKILARFKDYVTARIDVKLFCDDADLEMQYISDIQAAVTTPKWFQEGGKGYQIESISGELDISFRINKDGQFNIYLRGRDVWSNQRKRIPYWINYDMLSYNGIIEFNKPMAAWHDQPIIISHQAKAEELVKLHVEWSPCKTVDPSLEKKLKDTDKKLRSSLSRENSLKNSVSFRTGRAITWGPRKIRGGVRCYKEHGMGYTIKRLWWHILHLR